MSGRHAAEADGTGTGTAPASGGRDLMRRVLTIVLLVIAFVLVYLAAAAYIPRWWAQRIGRTVNGQMATGTLLGLCFGLVFTILPLGLLWITMRRPMSWKMRAFWLVLVVVLAAPNLMTLGVAVGGGGGSHAGQRTMDVNAPMFRGATAVGTLLALAIFVVMVIVYRRGRTVEAPPAPPPSPPPTDPSAPPAEPPSEPPAQT